MNCYQERIQRLRAGMREAGIDVYYIPMSDCHNSEYVAAHFRCVEFISGFTGSAGSVVVTRERAWLFADGRYYIQAARQIEGSGIELMKIGQPEVPELQEFLKELADRKVLGFDGSVVPADFGARFPGKVLCGRDLAGEIWEDRPEQMFTEIFELPLSSAGESAADKIRRIRQKLEETVPPQEEYLYLLNSLDDIAWIFNLRANDIQDNPVAYAYAAISRTKVLLFTGAKIPEQVEQELAQAVSLEVRDYAPHCLEMDGCGTVLLDEARISYDTLKYYQEKGTRILKVKNPSTHMKAVKNGTEIRCLKEALLRDSAVVVNFMYWLKHQIGKIPMDEVSVADYLQEMRMAQEGYIELSFGTISAYKENAAQMHYSPARGACKELHPEGFLLVDSGCQYRDGTTDITRTFALGPLTEEEKKAFTLTAVSMLRLMHAKFLKGCSGENLDIMAREPMWKVGWDYKCGTGHGVGHVLNVHEGPHNIRWKINYEHPTAVLEPGMVVTDEPGVYREGQYGVRTENELLVVPYLETPDGTFLQFENLTFIPIDLDAIDPAYMNEEDLEMLNSYHQATYDRIAPLVPEEVRMWLKEYTRPLTR
ncbi:MAG: aminopeptidase P family protein [Parasporobacterium sp.]|nr:aminopeptidase P family protein [Parasporobacterium sp.]